MSEETKKADRRYIGKVKNIETRNGTIQKVYMDNLEATNKDGSENKYYAGALVWADAKTGINYQVKQLQVYIPKGGMPADLAQKGFSAFITLNLEDKFEVTALV